MLGLSTTTKRSPRSLRPEETPESSGEDSAQPKIIKINSEKRGEKGRKKERAFPRRSALANRLPLQEAWV